jgi:hypothetical protein
LGKKSSIFDHQSPDKPSGGPDYKLVITVIIFIIFTCANTKKKLNDRKVSKIILTNLSSIILGCANTLVARVQCRTIWSHGSPLRHSNSGIPELHPATDSRVRTPTLPNYRR